MDLLTGSAITAGIAVAIALVIHLFLFFLLDRFSRLSELETDREVVGRLRQPARWSIVAVAISVASESEPSLAHIWDSVARFVIPALLGWVAFALVKAFAVAIESRADLSPDELSARSRKTRVEIFSRVASFVIVVLTLALMLFSIPEVRGVGVTLMASAGLAGLAVGAAAQPALKSFIAGVQMALTEPLRIGDLVVVDGHTGRVETIQMNLVVLKTWDERRIVIPTSRFFDTTFENWTRLGNELTGAVFLHLDPAAEVAPIRAEFERMLEAHPLWDRREHSLKMTEARPETIELRLAMSAADAASLFDLRCQIREGIMDWLRREMPGTLIRHRLGVEDANEAVLG